MDQLRELYESLPEDVARHALTHASWADRRADSYERLAFLGDSVLGLAVTTHLWPLLDEEKFGAGRLTKIRAHAVSGRSCRVVAERLEIPARMTSLSPEDTPANAQLVKTERVLASVIEAVIGACYLEFGYERTAPAVVDAFGPEIERALEEPTDYKSVLQERLAQRGQTVAYAVTGEEGPAHDRTFEVAANVDGEERARGTGKSKKDAEQAAAAVVLRGLGS